MQTIYFYPKIDYKATLSPNPYVEDLEKVLESHYTIVNEKYNTKGVLEFFKYLPKADIYFLNWIEDLPVYRYGKLQVVVFLFFLFLCRILNKRIVWVLHNKYSHLLSKNKWTDFMYTVLMSKSSLIITHSKEGIDFGRKYYPKHAHKIKYIFHPTKEPFPNLAYSKKYDFLIWGSIRPYKGILEFLRFTKSNSDIKSLKTLIVGQCSDPDYKDELSTLLSNTVELKDAFFEMDEIVRLAGQSRFVLFTHKATSVLSSGALIDTIRMHSRIIGPDIGAFKDLEHLSFVNTYKEYEEIHDIHTRYVDSNDEFDDTELDEFSKNNSWEKFGDQLHSLLKNNELD